MEKLISEIKKDEYNKEPVFFCRRCLSLHIREDISIGDYCSTCGSTIVESTDIYTWETMYKNKYGIEFIKNKKK